MHGLNTKCRLPFLVVLSMWTATPAETEAGPNIMAIGNYQAVPYKRAQGRDSFSGKEVVFSFPEPEFDFGRVVVRSSQPTSVVRRDFFVGYTGNDLRITNRAGGQGAASVSVQEVEIWLKVKGQLRPSTVYEWEIERAASRQNTSESNIPAVIPAMWADGQPIGVDVNITEPDPGDTDRIRRMLFPHGAIKTPQFEKQTGAAWIVLKPRSLGDGLGIIRFSFREADTPAATDAQSTMPIPVRYIPIRSEVEDQITEVLERSTAVLKRMQTPEGTWGTGNEVDANIVLTSTIAAGLGEVDRKDEAVLAALKWLAEQKPPERGALSIEAACNRLYCLARFGERGEFAPVVQSDAAFLSDAQLEDGGWGARSPKAPAAGDAVLTSNHDYSLAVLMALMEARFAGAEVDNRVFRNAMKYWTDAQTVDGGFTNRLARYGSIGQPTVAYTAAGTAGSIVALDMASGFAAKRCSLYLGSKEQLRTIDAGLKWLNEGYKEEYRSFGSFVSGLDPYLEPVRLLELGQVSGVTRLNVKDHFVESAAELLEHYDPATQMFGVRGPGGGGGLREEAGKFAEAPSPRRTGMALQVLGAGNAPTVLQRIIVGDEENGWSQYRGDIAHLVRYLGGRKGTIYNWRRSRIEDDISELAEVPVMMLSVVGAANWAEPQWMKIREYCLSGGTVVVDVSDDAEAQRSAVVEQITKLFPEYALAELPADAGVFAINKDNKPIAGIKALSNGFRHFLFIPPKSWSCAWQMYDTRGSEEAFVFMDDLLTYATDGTPPRSSFSQSSYPAPAASSRVMKAARLQIGSEAPAYPNMIDTVSRLMQSNYRTRVDETKPAEADLIWVNVTGIAPPSETAKQQLGEALRSGKQLFVDVVSGNVDWDESFKGVLRQIDPGITFQKLRRNDPIFTGEIPGTQGFDVTNVAFRKALHDRFSQAGRCDLYGIYLSGKRVGVYSAHDISSGVSYHYFPGCRGIMPEGARQVAMNVFLDAYGKKANPESRADAK